MSALPQSRSVPARPEPTDGTRSDLAPSGGVRRWLWPLRPVPVRTEVVARGLLHDARVARRLLVHAQARLGQGMAPEGVDGLLRAVPAWLRPEEGTDGPPPVVPVDALAVRSGDAADRAWRHLGGDGAVRDGPSTTLPAALLAHDRGTAVTLVASFAPGEGVDPTTRRGAYLWTHGDGADLVAAQGRCAVFALEWSDPAPFREDEVRALCDLQALLDELLAADRQLESLRSAVAVAARRELVAGLHDGVGQDVAHVAVELGLLARSHPEGDVLEEHATRLRDIVRQLRGELAQARGVDGGAAGT